MADDEARKKAAREQRRKAAAEGADPRRENARQQLQAGVTKAKETANQASEYVSPVVNGVIDAFGGYSELDRKIRKYNPTFYNFCETSFLKKLSFTNKPSKFILLLVALTILQAVLPIFKWPMDFLARLLGFIFLYNGGLAELQKGYKSEKTAIQVKAYMTAFLLLSAVQLIPSVLFDTVSHIGALWGFVVPVFFFICPDWNPDQPIAIMICDTIFAQLSLAMSSVIPVYGDQSQNLAILAAVVIAGLFWVGAIGEGGSYIATWAYLAFSTINALGADLAGREDSAYKPQQIVWHNLLAIWLWRYFISAIEAIGIPGIVSVLGLLLYYIPTYFLWITGFFGLMLLTKKTGDAKTYKADTWYARWLLGGFGAAVLRQTTAAPKAESSSSSSRQRSDQSSSRSRSSNSSSSKREGSRSSSRKSE